MFFRRSVTNTNELTRTTHALPVSVHRQTIFIAKSVVISRLHGTVAKFRTEVKFSLRYNDRVNSPRCDSRRHDILYPRRPRGSLNWEELFSILKYFYRLAAPGSPMMDILWYIL